MVLVIVGLGLVAYSLVLGEDSLIRRAVSTATDSEEMASSAPKERTLWLTVPKMARVEDLPVYDAPWDSETALDVSASHLDSSGFPWQDGANVYISGHRMGFPGTRSFLVFYDLDVLENGDEIFLTDSEGTKYTYKVFNNYVSDPFDWSPAEPVPGKSVVTLQTCTLPDYSDRLIIQAELTETTRGAGVPQEEAASQEGIAPQAIPQGPQAILQEGLAPQADLAPEGMPQEELAPGVIPQEENVPQAIPQQEVAPEAIPQGPQAIPQGEAAPQGQLAPEAAYPFFAFFAFLGRRSATRRSTGAPVRRDLRDCRWTRTTRR